MTERKENREVSVEILAGARPRVLLDGKDISDQAVDAAGGVHIDQPGMSMRIQAGTGEGAPPPLPETPANLTPRAVEAVSGRPEDDSQQASVIQTQTVVISAGGSVTIFLNQNAQVSQNQANLACKKKKRRCC